MNLRGLGAGVAGRPLECRGQHPVRKRHSHQRVVPCISSAESFNFKDFGTLLVHSNWAKVDLALAGFNKGRKHVYWSSLKTEASFLSESDIAISEYRGTSLIRNSLLLGPYTRTMPRALRWSYGGGGSYERGTPVVPCIEVSR